MTPRDAKMSGRAESEEDEPSRGCESRRYRTTQFAVFGAEQRDLAGDTRGRPTLPNQVTFKQKVVAFYVPYKASRRDTEKRFSRSSI